MDDSVPEPIVTEREESPGMNVIRVLFLIFIFIATATRNDGFNDLPFSGSKSKKLRAPLSSRGINDHLFFNAYFYNKLQEAVLCKEIVKDASFTKFRRWWKGVNIFQKDYVFIPINTRELPIRLSGIYACNNSFARCLNKRMTMTVVSLLLKELEKAAAGDCDTPDSSPHSKSGPPESAENME
ncbi:hypothetical protein SAY87_013361 [Trapa incisa]|uniref:Ubiquitin-like protease family profile domain-containing protein n=1 Tax=Trapa incisa TaxID=236973 RepID=A0AAN7QD63_9MYRT|nr:hypothetical protein SAY87_013361 [Trapa incisa]